MNPKDDNDLSYVLPIGSFLFLSKHNSVIEDLPSMREALNPIVGTGGREGGGEVNGEELLQWEQDAVSEEAAGAYIGQCPQSHP